jgi:hypothetical protein
MRRVGRLGRVGSIRYGLMIRPDVEINKAEWRPGFWGSKMSEIAACHSANLSYYRRGAVEQREDLCNFPAGWPVTISKLSILSTISVNSSFLSVWSTARISQRMNKKCTGLRSSPFSSMNIITSLKEVPCSVRVSTSSVNVDQSGRSAE